jgi:type I restriction enzyme S subunit
VQRGDDVDNGVPVVRISNIIKNTYDAGGMVRTSPDVSNRYKRTLLKGGELLLSIRGTVGRVAIAPHGAREHNVSREIAVIPLLTDVNREYIWALMLSDGAQRFLAGEVRGIAQSGINLRDVRRLAVALPPEPMQHEFAERAAEIHSIMTQQQSMLRASDQLVASLMAQLFDGRNSTDRAA